ncbi:MAG: response regulator [bacterium]
MKSTFKVLIVEDEALTAMGLKIYLEKLGVHALTPVANGEDAIMVALQEDPALIFMDIRLAGALDGIEAAEKILKKKKIGIVFMTGYSTDYIQERAQKVNPLGFLEKPINFRKIKQIIEEVNTDTNL